MFIKLLLLRNDTTTNQLHINGFNNLFMFEAQIDYMWFLEIFKVSEILRVTIFYTTCSPNFPLNYLHYTMHLPVHQVFKTIFAIGTIFTTLAFIEWIKIQQKLQHVLYKLVCLFIPSIGYFITNHKDYTFSLNVCLHWESDMS
jgi:hypothetical protein